MPNRLRNTDRKSRIDQMVDDYRSEVKEISRPLIVACDRLLQDYPARSFGIMGSGATGVYFVLHQLAKHLDRRGRHQRVKLLDISTKMLLGPRAYRHYQILREHSGSHFTFVPREDEREFGREKKVFGYAKASGLLDHEGIVLLDLGFLGTVVHNLKRIIEEHSPEHRGNVDAFLFSSNPGSSIGAIKGVSESTGFKIAMALEQERVFSDRMIQVLGLGSEYKSSKREIGFRIRKIGNRYWPTYERAGSDALGRMISRKIEGAQMNALKEAVDQYLREKAG